MRSVAPPRLQAAGFIKYSRGKIQILDHQELEDSACQCYEVVKLHCARLIGIEPGV